MLAEVGGLQTLNNEPTVLKGGLAKSSSNARKRPSDGVEKPGPKKRAATKNVKMAALPIIEVLPPSEKNAQRTKLEKPDTFKDLDPINMDMAETELLEKEVKTLRKSLHQSEEKTKYWRRKSLDITQKINKNKRVVVEKATQLELQIEELAEASVKLQNKLKKATSDNTDALSAVVQCMGEHETLIAEKDALLTELNMLKVERNDEEIQQEETQKNVISELSKSLETALDDLQSLLRELEATKKKFNAVSKEKQILETEVKRSKESVVGGGTDTNRNQAKMDLLNERIEKMVFKCSVLSQTNKELKEQAEARGIELGDLPAEKFLESDEMVKLERLCLKRYSCLLEKANNMCEK